MNQQIAKISAEISIERKIDFIHVVGDYYAFRSVYTSQASKKGLASWLPKSSTQGLIHKDDIPKRITVRTKLKEVTLVNKYKGFGGHTHKATYFPFLVNKKFLEEFRRTKAFIVPYSSKDSADVGSFFDEMSNEKSDKRILVFFSRYDHTWRDHNFRMLSRPIYFDYIDARMNNKNYHLNKVLEHLRKREDIEIEEGQILDIPYYSRDEDYTRYLSFWWYPTDRVYRNLYTLLHKSEEKELWNIHRVIEAKDKLGLEKYRKSVES